MRLLILSILVSVLCACGESPVGVPLEAPVVAASTAAPALETTAHLSAAHPPATLFGAWTAGDVAIVVSEEGIGRVAAGVVSLTPYGVTSASPDEVVLTTEDGTEYRFALGSEPGLSTSALPNIKLLQN